jgi:Ca2+-transporting ATPase
MSVGTLGVISWATGAYGEAVARTMGLTVFSLMNIAFALETSNEERSLFSTEILDNPTLLKGAGLALLATILAVELDLLNRILDTVNLNFEQWAICVVAALLVIVVAEVKKLLKIQTSDVAQPVAAPASVPA